MYESHDNNDFDDDEFDDNDDDEETVEIRPSLITRKQEQENNNNNNKKPHESFYRRIRTAGGKKAQSLCITLPRKFLRNWNLDSGDYVIVTSYDNKIVVEKPRV